MRGKWWHLRVVHPRIQALRLGEVTPPITAPLRARTVRKGNLFSQMPKVVLQSGIAPASHAYRACALLLSYKRDFGIGAALHLTRRAFTLIPRNEKEPWPASLSDFSGLDGRRSLRSFAGCVSAQLRGPWKVKVFTRKNPAPCGRPGLK